MPDEIQNPISEEKSIPVSPQESMADAPILPMDSTPADIPPEALETPINIDIPVSLKDYN